MTRFTNQGPPWTRVNGTVVQTGETFDATPREVERIQRRGLRMVPVAETGEAKETSAAAPAAGGWTLSMTPEKYLEVHPGGPHAALARTLTGAVSAVTPAAKDLAEREGIDLTTVTGTGAEGRITVIDVQEAVEAKKAQPG